MLEITIPEQEFFDNRTQRFIKFPEAKICLEHSLYSLAKWESKWHKPFYSKKEKTEEEMRDYIRCMTITKKVDPAIYYRMTQANFDSIKEYLEDPMSALVFNDDNSGSSRETPTAEMFYYSMFQQNIPLECEKWHIRRLMSLIRYSGAKNKPKDKRKQNTSDLIERNKRICEANRKKFNTRG